jgi:hypothetical protein
VLADLKLSFKKVIAGIFLDHPIAHVTGVLHCLLQRLEFVQYPFNNGNISRLFIG